jgi:hypothetical protein
MKRIVCSKHATVRAQQRGVTLAQIEAVIRYGDMEALRGGGCSSIWISKKELERLGPCTPEGVPTDRLQGLTVLESEDATCITVFRNCGSKNYRINVGSGR